jgi:predicted HicB family RNase H-like nuclease
MQKLKAAENRGAPPMEGKTKRLTIDIPESLHRSLKMKAVDEGGTMAEVMRQLLIRQQVQKDGC